MSQILITGGAGAIGANLTISLAKNKDNFIYVIDNLSSSKKKNFFKKKNIKYFILIFQIKKDYLNYLKNINLIIFFI